MKGFDIKTFKTKNGDIKKEIDVFNFVYGSEAIKNLITERCQIIKGELPYNIVTGIGLKSDKETLDLDISSIILNTKGVSKITSFESGIINNVYTAKIKIQTIYNDLIEVNI